MPPSAGEESDAPYRAFGRDVYTLMRHMGLTQSAVARKLGVSTVSVGRWIRGEIRPREQAIDKLADILRRPTADGRMRRLNEHEIAQLKALAGYKGALEFAPEVDHAHQVEECIVYSHQYERSTFPSAWSRRVIEVEQLFTGSTDVMWAGLPSITRPAEFYLTDYHKERYDEVAVAAYVKRHIQRQKDFEERMRDHSFRHLYSSRDIQELVENCAVGERFRNISDVTRSQVERVCSWLEADEFDFDVRITDGDVPANTYILARNHVLIEFPQSSFTLTGSNIIGVEITGELAASRFSKHFDGLWSGARYRTRKQVLDWLAMQLQSIRG